MSFSLPTNSMESSLRAAGFRARRDATVRDIRLAALRVPLVVKLLGANVAVVGLLLLAWGQSRGAVSSEPMVVAAVAAIVVHFVMVLVALRPIRELEMVAARVWQGDYAARVKRSRVADVEVLRVGAMFNILLDGLAAERARLRALAAEVIEAGDRERAAVSHELQETTAQHLAALLFELAVVARDTEDPLLAARIRSARDTTETILDDVRVLSRTIHSSLLENLGVEAALRKLVREAALGNAIEFDVDADLGPARLAANLESILYRAAQELVRNTVRHASPRRVRIKARRTADAVMLSVFDDGRGFEAAAVDRQAGQRRHSLGVLRERLALVDGWLEINSAVGAGTTVTVTVPLNPAPDVLH